MLKPLTLAVALALLAPATAFAQDAAPAAQKTAPAAPAWVARSNEYTQMLIAAQAPFQPEQVSFFGVPGFDDQVFDYRADYARRFRDATAKAKAAIQAKAASERDPNVKQDIGILLQAADDAIEASETNERLPRPWLDAGQTVFQGIQALLSDQTPAERRAQAVVRLQRYAGLAPCSTPLATLARERYDER